MLWKKQNKESSMHDFLIPDNLADLLEIVGATIICARYLWKYFRGKASTNNKPRAEA